MRFSQKIKNYKAGLIVNDDNENPVSINDDETATEEFIRLFNDMLCKWCISDKSKSITEEFREQIMNALTIAVNGFIDTYYKSKVLSYRDKLALSLDALYLSRVERQEDLIKCLIPKVLKENGLFISGVSVDISNEEQQKLCNLLKAFE